MEEGNELDMSLFGENGLELNMNYNPDLDEPNLDEDEITTEETVEDNIQDTTDDLDQEEVGSGETDEGGNEGGESSSNLYSSLATVVYEQGLLPSLDLNTTKIETIDDLVNAFKVEKEILAKNQLDEYISNLDISKITTAKQAIQDLTQVTEEKLKADLNLAKKVIYDDYINQGIDENKAARYLKRIIDLGEDAIVEEANDSLESLKEFQIRKIEQEKVATLKQLEDEKIQQAELEQKLKKTIYETKDLINGFKPTKTVQDKVHKSITEIVGKSPDGIFENKFMKERRENPLEFETRMYYFYELTNGFKDYSKLSISAKSNAVKDLERIAQTQKIKDNGTPLWMQDNNSYDNVTGHVLNL